MKRRIRYITLAAVLASLLLLTGCTLGSSVDSLFVLPQLPEKYRQFSSVLDDLLNAGNTYVTPAEGTNIESVQMVDLDGDKEKEAVVLLRHNGDSKPLKVMIFQQINGLFEPIYTLENSGTGIGRIDYPDMDQDGMAELVIGWQGEEDRRSVSVYRVDRTEQPLLESDYEEYLLTDLIGDGVPGLFLLRGAGAENAEKSVLAEYHSWQNSGVHVSRNCRINSGIEAIRRGSIVGGYLPDDVPAVFVTGIQSRDTATTAALIWTGGNLVNVTRDSAPYRSCQLEPQDIDGDGVTEIPCRLSDGEDVAGLTEKDSLVSWLRYDRSGEAEKAAETYHCQSYGWYMTWPEEYWEQVTVTGGDVISGENQVEFSVQGIPFASLYSITCESRESRAQMDTRFIVTRLPGIIYAGEIYGADTEDGTVITAFRDSFSLIVSSWDSTGKE